MYIYFNLYLYIYIYVCAHVLVYIYIPICVSISISISISVFILYAMRPYCAMCRRQVRARIRVRPRSCDFFVTEVLRLCWRGSTLHRDSCRTQACSGGGPLGPCLACGSIRADASRVGWAGVRSLLLVSRRPAAACRVHLAFRSRSASMLADACFPRDRLWLCVVVCERMRGRRWGLAQGSPRFV